MPSKGDKLMQAQRAEKKRRKTAFADPKHCPKCGMLTSRGHFIWCPDWTGMFAGNVKG